MGARNSGKSNQTARLAALLAAALAALALLLPQASATTAIAATLQELIDGADAVVVGKVFASESRWNAEHTRIYTYTTFEVEEFLKGSGPATITIRTLGGQVGDQVMHVEGVPRFQLNQREALFLQSFAAEANTFSVHSWEQGRFRILRSEETGQEMLQRSLSGTRLVPGGQPVRGALSSFSSIRTLDDLRSAVRRRGEER